MNRTASLPSRRPALAAHSAVSALALAAAALLAGCASPGAPHTPLAQTTPADMGLQTPAAHDTAAPSQWWKALGDEQLNALVTQALQDSPSLAVSRARLAQAVALSQVREAANGPQVNLGVDATRQRYTAHGLVPAPVAGNTYNTGTVQATLSWSPDFFGQHAAELQAALGQARAAQADAAAAQGLHQHQAGVELAGAQVHGQAALGEHLAFGGEHHQVVAQACAVALLRKAVGFFCTGHGIVLQGLLAGERLDGGHGVARFLHRIQHGAVVLGDGGVQLGLASPQLGAQAATVKNGQAQGRRDTHLA